MVKKLAIFGFTLNQAKVYLTVLQAGSISVSKIAESTRLHRQDIYNIIPNLEKKGVVTQTLGNPILIRGIPVEKALESLISKERENALERITRMEANLKDISNAGRILQETGTGHQNEELHFSLLTKENEIRNRTDQLYEKAKVEINIVASLELITIKWVNVPQLFRTATNNGVKIRLLIAAQEKEEYIHSIVERVRPKTEKFAAKFISKSTNPFQIIDNKEVWITTEMKTVSGIPYVLWSNSYNIVATYLECFERLWKSHNTKLIPPLET